MARTTKQLSGAGKDKFLRGALARETALAPEIAQRLGDTLCEGIADIRVRREAWQPGAGQREADAVRGARSVDLAPVPARSAAFDPFVFSALAVLTKHGVPALTGKLESIGDAGQLQALAKAQHLAVDPALADLAAVRAAILHATQQRLAERRAAAS